MASLGRSFKPPSYLSSRAAARRPPMAGRTMSNSSDMSPMSPPPELRQDDFALSSRPSPVSLMDHPQWSPRSPSTGLRPTSSGATSARSRTPSPFRKTNESSQAPTAKSTPASSRPIAIELPHSNSSLRPQSGQQNSTPPAPLSGRGDLPGGYFPLHEDKDRVHRPHPFQLDASKARMRSLQLASRSSSSDSQPVVPSASATGTIATAPASVMTNQSSLQPPSTATSSTAKPATPVASYYPAPSIDSSMPVGKYYPSNYERRKAEKHGRQVSESRVTTTSNRQPPSPGHSRNESDAKRRLQQYQRDMIAQARMALNGGSTYTLQSLRSMGFGSPSNPDKPKLEPLGSPGPVTPMELGGSNDGYLAARGPADDAQAEEIARALRAEEQRRRREGASSPIVGIGPTTC